jgi:hypothetical protein
MRPAPGTLLLAVVCAAAAAPATGTCFVGTPSFMRFGFRGGASLCAVRSPLRGISSTRSSVCLQAKYGDLDDGEDWANGDITSLLSNNAPAPATRKGAAPTDTDMLLGTGLAFSEQLGEAVEKAVKNAAKGVAQSTVPALAVVFFSSQYADGGYGRVLPVLLRSMAMHGGKAWKDGVSVIGCTVEGFFPFSSALVGES